MLARHWVHPDPSQHNQVTGLLLLNGYVEFDGSVHQPLVPVQNRGLSANLLSGEALHNTGLVPLHMREQKLPNHYSRANFLRVRAHFEGSGRDHTRKLDHQ